MKRLTRFLSLVGLIAAALSPSTLAQSCFGPDQLDGACCDTVDLQLPNFPPLAMDGSALHWTNCQPQPKANVVMTLSPPMAQACGSYAASFSVKNSAGLTFMGGMLEMTYSRTWDEISPNGQTRQVWRFLLMGELNNPPLPVPGPPLPADNPSFYHGHLDYALACNTPAPIWEHAFVLFHNCDDFLHRQPIAADVGVYDPATTYAFVAPDNAAQPFDHTAIIPPLAGPVVIGALRDPAAVAGALACYTRDPVVQGSLQPIAQGCTCPLSLNLPPRNAATRMNAFGACGNATLSLDTTAIGFPWLHMMSTSIGRWTNPAVFPGQEAALVYEGPVIWEDVCNSQRYAHLQYGAATVGGWMRVSVTPVILPQKMLDMRSNWAIPIPGPLLLPMVGLVFPAPGRRHVMFLDVM